MIFTSSITISIVDSNTVHAQVLQASVHELKFARVISTHPTATDFLLHCNNSKRLPQIVLVDIDLPIVDGIFLTDYLHLYYPAIKVIAVSTYCHEEVVHDMFSCGAIGYVYKLFANTVHNHSLHQGASPQHPYIYLHQAIQAAYLNRQFIDPLLTLYSEHDYALMNIGHLLTKRMQQRKHFSQLGLNSHEMQITILYAGTTLTKEEIASILLFSVKKIEKDISAIYKKLAIADRHALGSMCLNKGFVKNARGIV